MLEILDLRGCQQEEELIRSLISRHESQGVDVERAVGAIINDVRTNKDDALRRYTLEFDKVQTEDFLVSECSIMKSLNSCDKDYIKAIKNAAKNIEDFHKRQLSSGFTMKKDGDITMGQRIIPLQRVGIYVPGGTAAYPSSVLMNAIPAKIAGVSEIIMVTPPGKNGEVDKSILAAASIAGIDRIYAVGGAQAIAALAYGTETIPGVDKIVGPGNVFVATAKKQVFGIVDIDMIAGPSEVVIVADKTANPKFLAADLMSQAEHDVLASGILITDSTELAEATKSELMRQVRSLGRKAVIEKSLREHGAIVVCEDVERAIGISDTLAPEHLELCVKNPFEALKKVRNAGSVFLGNYSPEPLGDYYAGPNHVLPTNGSARFFSPLSVDSFIKRQSFICYSKEALREVSDEIMIFARKEGLTAHENSIKVRNDD